MISSFGALISLFESSRRKSNPNSNYVSSSDSGSKSKSKSSPISSLTPPESFPTLESNYLTACNSHIINVEIPEDYQI